MQKFQIIFAGYGPEHTSFSKSLKIMGDKIAHQFSDLVDVQYVYNVMDLGYKSEDILLTVTMLWSKLLLRNLVQKLWK